MIVMSLLEALLDDTLRAAERAKAAGVDVKCDVFPEMQHVFQFMAGNAPEADDAIARLAAWVKPAVGLGKHATHPGGGDIIGYGNRNYVLKLLGSGDRGDAPPYRLAARLDVNDGIQTAPALMADRWHHVALTVTPENGKRRMRLFLDGKPAADGLSAR